jgi:hypothetical protein
VSAISATHPGSITIFDDVCVLVTAAFALTLMPGFIPPARSLLSGRDQGTALLVFAAEDKLCAAQLNSKDFADPRLGSVPKIRFFHSMHIAICGSALI